MSTDEKGTPTPQNVINLATEHVTLPKLTLLGTFGSLTQPGALIRDGKGRIQRVSLNDKISDGVVAAIGDNSVVLLRRGRTVTLKLPNG
ncbi:MAG: type II secretion system protein N [Sulfitobacter sp.]|jgi:type II secretion system (T2SS) protein C|uniref:type II secretion system protein N n=1 Tax=Sulfitobacter sp. TaxID=1903071 RepID=UPI000C420579|nr:pilus assembly protein PilZ [Roseobacter sp.]MBV50176.1 pilus assembly protein PilZ [Roseobacter sp.]|tara:strand:- start:903 stop:1169 length:267 start_codon:yes stop_codon:yes gene_type:complete